MLDIIAALPRESLLYTVLLAVVIAPWVYSWRQRVRRVLVRLSWIGVGIAIGTLL